MNKINVNIENNIANKYKIETDYFTSTSLKVLKLLELDNKEISLIICDDKFIHNINKQYREKDTPTDVISFAYREEEFPLNEIDGYEMLGDIFLSLERANEQHFEFATTFREEIIRLLIHSILHLIGYDHVDSEDDAQIMREKEDEIMEKIRPA